MTYSKPPIFVVPSAQRVRAHNRRTLAPQVEADDGHLACTDTDAEVHDGTEAERLDAHVVDRGTEHTEAEPAVARRDGVARRAARTIEQAHGGVRDRVSDRIDDDAGERAVRGALGAHGRRR